MQNLYARSVFFVQDVERAMRFYTEQLGFTLDWDSHDGVFQVSLFGFELILNAVGERNRTRPGHGRLFIGLDDDQGEPFRKHLAEKGIQTLRVEWGRPTLVVRDADANELFFWLANDAELAKFDSRVLASNEITEPSSPSGTSHQSVATLVARFFESVLNQAEPAAASEIVAPDFVVHHPMGDTKGTDALLKMVDGFRAGFPNLRYTIAETVVEGDRAAVRWVATGTHDGDFLRIPPTHRAVTVAGADIFHSADGRLTETWVNSDLLGLFQQLGTFPPTR